MSSSNSGPGKPGKPAPDGAPSKKPSAIIDLKATEVTQTKDEPEPAEAKPGEAKAAEPKPQQPAKPAEPQKPAAAAPDAGKVSAASAAAAAAAGRPVPPITMGEPPKASKPQQPPKDEKVAAPSKPAAAVGSGAAGTGSTSAVPPAVSGGTRSGLVSLFTHTIAGVVGGFLALLAADSLAPQIGLPSPATLQTTTDALRQRLTQLESKLAAQPAAPAVSPELAGKLASAEQRLATLEKTGAQISELQASHARLAEQGRQLADTLSKGQASVDGQRIAQLEAQLAALSAAAGTDPEKGRIPQLAAITGKLGDLEAAVQNQLAALHKSLGQEIDSRLGPTAEAGAVAKAGVQRIDRELSAVKTEAARLTQHVDGLKGTTERLEQAQRAAAEQGARLQTALDGFRTDVAGQLKMVARPKDVEGAVAPVTAKMSALEQTLAGVMKSEQDRQSNAERIVLSLELANLKRALDRGGSFAQELAEVQKIAKGKLDLKPLERFRNEGVPSLLELTRDFRPVAHAAIDADTVVEDSSVVDRLLSGAKSIVRIRKVSHAVDDKSPEAVIARMETALKENRLSDVIEEAKALPPRSLAAARPWLEKVEARSAVDRSLKSIEAQLKAAVGGSNAPSKGVQ